MSVSIAKEENAPSKRSGTTGKGGDMTITVRRLTGYYERLAAPRKVHGKTSQYAITAIWQVHDGSKKQATYVAETGVALTVIDHEGHMLTHWHAGISAGDLARQQSEYIDYQKGQRR